MKCEACRKEHLICYNLGICDSFSSANPPECGPRRDRDLETKIMRNLKHLIGGAGLTDWELKMLYGICSQIDKKIGD